MEEKEYLTEVEACIYLGGLARNALQLREAKASQEIHAEGTKASTV